MGRRIGRGNRIALLGIGVVLTAVGGAALVRGLALFPGVLGPAGAPVTGPAARHFARDQSWFWPVIAVAALAVMLLALWWLIAQGRTRALHRITLEPDTRRGTTRVPARAVTAALEDDLTASPYIRQARAVLTGTSARPRLALGITLRPGADAGEAVGRISAAVSRMRQALESPQLAATVRIRTARH